jgi:hypothetical protein
MLQLENQITQAILEKAVNGINDIINTVKPLAKSVSPAQKQKLRAMATGRQGIVELVSNIAIQNSDSLGKKDNPEDLVNRLSMDRSYERLNQAILQLMELIADTQFLNSVDVMHYYDTYMGALNNDRKRNASLDEAMKQVDAYHKRFGGDAGTTPETPVSPDVTPKES